MARTAYAKELAAFVSGGLEELRDPEVAVGMAAYLKTDMPCYGVKKPLRTDLIREMKKRFVPADEKAYQDGVLALWSLPHREEKYLALDFARAFKKHHTPAALPLYERMIREGQWWDLVDDIASNLVGMVHLKYREDVTPLMRAWNADEDMWIRRTSILSQLKHKEKTDEFLLFRNCEYRAHEKEFFIRKAIGWALRAYSYVNPKAVKHFVKQTQREMSGLSVREATKQLARDGLWP